MPCARAGSRWTASSQRAMRAPVYGVRMVVIPRGLIWAGEACRGGTAMASDADDGYAPRDPLAPLYSGPDENAPTPGSRGPRQGPLGARLSQRASAPPAPTASPLAYG